MQKKVENIIKEVAADSSLPEYVVKAIVECQFQCAREAMKKGESGDPSTFLNVRLRHLGLLVAKPGKIKKLHAVKEAKNNENEK
jgi:predicted ATP-dependent protease